MDYARLFRGADVVENLDRRIDMQTCREHHEILRTLLEMLPTVVPFDAAEAAAALTRLGVALVAHLKLEDDRLYPVLEKSEDRTVRETAARYRIEMGSLRANFSEFVEAFGSEQKIERDPQTFLTAWMTVRKALETRMAKEDYGLYAIADEVFGRDQTG